MVSRAAGYLIATSSLALATAAHAQETTTYTYDALGRLVATGNSGSANNGLTTGIAYDPAGNRSSYSVSGAPGTPAPTPTPTNTPPVTALDTGGIDKCSTGAWFNVVNNDSDPDGDLPLTLVSVTNGALGAASVYNSTSVWYDPHGTVGLDNLTYTIRDARGATATGTLRINVVTGNCGIDP